jgi:hypothetical protein
VTALRARTGAAGEAHQAELAEALFALSRALDADERTAEAYRVARDGLVTLSPAFLAKPAAYEAPMQALVAQYLSLGGRTCQPPEAGLLTPVSVALGRLMQAEDGAAEDDW